MTTKIGEFLVDFYERYRMNVNAVYQKLTGETLEEAFGDDNDGD